MCLFLETFSSMLYDIVLEIKLGEFQEILKFRMGIKLEVLKSLQLSARGKMLS